METKIVFKHKCCNCDSVWETSIDEYGRHGKEGLTFTINGHGYETCSVECGINIAAKILKELEKK